MSQGSQLLTSGLAALFGVHAESLAYSAGSPATVAGLVNRNIVKGKDFFRQFESEPVDFSLLGLSEIEIKKSDMVRDVAVAPDVVTPWDGQPLTNGHVEWNFLVVGTYYRWTPGAHEAGFPIDGGNLHLFGPGLFRAAGSVAYSFFHPNSWTGLLQRSRVPFTPQAGEHFIDDQGLRHRIRFVTGTNISWICFCTPVAISP